MINFIYYFSINISLFDHFHFNLDQSLLINEHVYQLSGGTKTDIENSAIIIIIIIKNYYYYYYY